MSKITHTHVDEFGNQTTHTHEMTGEHGHYHSPEEKKNISVLTGQVKLIAGSVSAAEPAAEE